MPARRVFKDGVVKQVQKPRNALKNIKVTPHRGANQIRSYGEHYSAALQTLVESALGCIADVSRDATCIADCARSLLTSGSGCDGAREHPVTRKGSLEDRWGEDSVSSSILHKKTFKPDKSPVQPSSKVKTRTSFFSNRENKCDSSQANHRSRSPPPPASGITRWQVVQ